MLTGNISGEATTVSGNILIEAMRTAFRAEIGDAPLTGLIANMARIQGSTTTEHQYQHSLAQFRRHPSPPGHVLEWVCRDNLDYLDVTQDRLEMNARY